MSCGHKQRVTEALRNIDTAERQLQAAKWELDDCLAAANSAGHTQEELAEWLGMSQQAISIRLQQQRERQAAAARVAADA